MKQIGVTEIRHNLADILRQDDKLYEMAMRTPDDQLLKMDLYADLGLDSLDIEEIFDQLMYSHGINGARVFNPLTKFSFHEEQTIENFIDMVNYYLSYYLSQAK